MTELTLLRVLLLLSMAIAPLGTNRFVPIVTGKLQTGLHVPGLLLATIGLLVPVPFLCGAWLLFTAGSFGLFLLESPTSVKTPHGFALAVPFLFSNIAGVWLVSGANDLGLLGYGAGFSYYAALHGMVLGWMLVGAIAALAQREGPYRRIYVGSVLVCFVSFLVIAIGIDQLRVIKPVGVVGLSVAVPVAMLTFLREAWAHKKAFALGLLSLLGLVFTMVLAWRNELGMLAHPPAMGIRGMVSVHGLVNAVVVGPALLVAVRMFDAAQPATEAQSPERSSSSS